MTKNFREDGGPIYALRMLEGFYRVSEDYRQLHRRADGDGPPLTDEERAYYDLMKAAWPDVEVGIAEICRLCGITADEAQEVFDTAVLKATTFSQVVDRLRWYAQLPTWQTKWKPH